MRMRLRLVGILVLTGATVSACNAILGISDLSDPGSSDAAGLEATTEPDALVPGDAKTDGAIPPCSAAATPDPCVVVEPQTAGAIFPSWPITSDLSIAESSGFSEATHPKYTVDGPGSVLESHTKLSWKTAYRKGDAGDDTFDYKGATTACEAFGAGWRLPTRIELATTQYRAAPLTSGFNTSCVPPEFDQSFHVYAWTSTSVPAAVGDSEQVYVGDETNCGFVGASTKDSKEWVRCVKGATAPATFIVTKAKDKVRAVETGLLWERTGVVVDSYAQAKAHCDVLGARIPVIQELYGIIDTRTVALFNAKLFVAPVLDAGSAKAILSQTVYAVDPDGGVPTYEVVSVRNSPWGADTGMGPTSSATEMLVRCVSAFVAP